LESLLQVIGIFNYDWVCFYLKDYFITMVMTSIFWDLVALLGMWFAFAVVEFISQESTSVTFQHVPVLNDMWN
jgi:hypothetical protein